MKTIVIKCGGSMIDHIGVPFIQSLKELKKDGYKMVLVHGGGPQINKMLEQKNVQSNFVHGLRKTTEEMIEVIEMVLSGQTNRKLVGKLQAEGLQAIGLNGSDGFLLQGKYINKEIFGLVGEVEYVNKEILSFLMEKDMIPVLTPLAMTNDGIKLNVNADYAAQAVATALKCDHCLFVTDVDGIKVAGEIVETIPIYTVNELIKSGGIYGGMIPKVQSAIHVLEKGVKSVTIVNGNKLFYHQQKWWGTKIMMEERVVQ